MGIALGAPTVRGRRFRAEDPDWADPPTARARDARRSKNEWTATPEDGTSRTSQSCRWTDGPMPRAGDRKGASAERRGYGELLQVTRSAAVNEGIVVSDVDCSALLRTRIG